MRPRLRTGPGTEDLDETGTELQDAATVSDLMNVGRLRFGQFVNADNFPPKPVRNSSGNSRNAMLTFADSTTRCF